MPTLDLCYEQKFDYGEKKTFGKFGIEATYLI